MNPIDATFSKPASGIRLMTHVVADWPTPKACRDMLRLMARHADLIEIQIPFSDPMADGPVIMQANQEVLDAGTRLAHSFELMAEMSAELSVPLLFMTYLNVPFRMGLETFAAKAKKAGASGVILPDLPFDEDERTWAPACREHDLASVPVVSPDLEEGRLARVLASGSGFVYTTLKVGVTGRENRDPAKGLAWLSTLRKHTRLPIAAGFGIRSADQVASLAGKAEVAVVGSEVIRRMRDGGLSSVEEFLGKLR